MAWNYSNTSFETTLSSGINAVTTSVTVGSVSGLPVSFPFTLVVDPDNALRECITVASAVGTTLTVTRGVDGTSGASHSAGATVVHAIIARDVAEPQTHMAASTNVHGIGGSSSVVGTAASQTLTNKSISGATNTLSNINGASISGAASLAAEIVAQPFASLAASTSTNGTTLLTLTDTSAAKSTKVLNVSLPSNKAVSVDSDSVLTLDDTDMVIDTDRGQPPAATVGRLYVRNATSKSALILDRPGGNTDNIQEWRDGSGAKAIMDKDCFFTSRGHTINQIAADTTNKLINAKNSGGSSVFTVDHTGATVSSAGITGATLTSTGLTTANSLTVTTTGTLDAAVVTNNAAVGSLTVAGNSWTAGAWTGYTPTWTANGTAVSLGNGTITGKWHRLGRFITVVITLTMGSTTTYGTSFYLFTVPATAADLTCLGSAKFLDAGTQDRNGTSYFFDTTHVVATSNAGAAGQLVPHTWAANDVFSIQITYETT